MTNFEKIKKMSKEDLILLLRKMDESGIYNYCNDEFCNNCDEKCNDTCKFEDIDPIEWWLNSETM